MTTTTTPTEMLGSFERFVLDLCNAYSERCELALQQAQEFDRFEDGRRVAAEFEVTRELICRQVAKWAGNRTEEIAVCDGVGLMLGILVPAVGDLEEYLDEHDPQQIAGHEARLRAILGDDVYEAAVLYERTKVPATTE